MTTRFPGYYTIKEIEQRKDCRDFGITESVIYDAIKRGNIKGVKRWGRRLILIPINEVNRILKMSQLEYACFRAGVSSCCSVKEIAKATGLSPKHICTLIRQKKLDIKPEANFGNLQLFDIDKVCKVLDKADCYYIKERLIKHKNGNKYSPVSNHRK